MFPAASQPVIQPSSKRFHIMECAGLVDESSQQTSNLAWYGCMRSAWDSAQRKFEAKVSEGKSLSSILTTVSKTERVSDSPCQGRATKVNSQVYDLMSSRPRESRSVPISVKEATNLETTLRGVMESYNFQLWIVTALFRFLGDSGCCPMDDPLLDQFQRSFSRGAENVAAALASSTAFVSAKRRESFLTHMFPSVTDAQKRKLLSDPLFDQKDLFAPTSIIYVVCMYGMCLYIYTHTFRSSQIIQTFTSSKVTKDKLVHIIRCLPYYYSMKNLSSTPVILISNNTWLSRLNMGQ